MHLGKKEVSIRRGNVFLAVLVELVRAGSLEGIVKPDVQLSTASEAAGVVDIMMGTQNSRGGRERVLAPSTTAN